MKLLLRSISASHCFTACINSMFCSTPGHIWSYLVIMACHCSPSALGTHFTPGGFSASALQGHSPKPVSTAGWALPCSVRTCLAWHNSDSSYLALLPEELTAEKMWLGVQCSESASFQAHYEFFRELERANGSQIFGNVPWGIIIISSHCVRISWAASQVKACKTLKQAAKANPRESQPHF